MYCCVCTRRLKPPPPGCDISLVLIVDQPRAALSPDQVLWLQQLQARCMHRVRVRINEANLGASAARNRALQVGPPLGFRVWGCMSLPLSLGHSEQ